MEEQKKLSSSMEDYLKEICILEQEHKAVRVTDVASTLGISKASVNKAINGLKELGMIQHEHYGTIQLTEEGRDTAKAIIENYKVCYKFLNDILGVPSETAREEAHRMEHILSKGTRKKLKKFTKKQKKS